MSVAKPKTFLLFKLIVSDGNKLCAIIMEGSFMAENLFCFFCVRFSNSRFNDEIKAAIKDFKFSPTALNCYLACPKRFLYEHILKIEVNYYC